MRSPPAQAQSPAEPPDPADAARGDQLPALRHGQLPDGRARFRLARVRAARARPVAAARRHAGAAAKERGGRGLQGRGQLAQHAGIGPGRVALQVLHVPLAQLGAGGNLQLGITAAFAAAAAVGVVALVITRRLPPGTTASPPPAAQRAPAPVPGQEAQHQRERG